MKKAQDYLSEAKTAVLLVTTEEGIAIHSKGGSIFIDVRDSNSLRQSGTIAGALHVPRGMIELSADPESPYHRTFFPRVHSGYIHQQPFFPMNLLDVGCN